MGLGSNKRGFGHYKYRSNGNIQGNQLNTQKLPCAIPRSTRNLSTPLRILFPLFASIPSVWIDSTVEATGKHLQFGLTALLP